MIKVDISADSKFPVDRASIRARIAEVLGLYRVRGDMYVSVMIVGDRKMRWINKEYRNKDYATDVLSFPTEDPSQKMEEVGFKQEGEDYSVLGDIVVSYPQAVKIAAEKGKRLDEVVGNLVEHGMLHLLGIHHD